MAWTDVKSLTWHVDLRQSESLKLLWTLTNDIAIRMYQMISWMLSHWKPSVTYNINMPTEEHGNGCGYGDPTISADKTDRNVWSTETTQKVACQRQDMTNGRCQRWTWQMPKWTWQGNTAITQGNRSGLKSPMKANCNGGTEMEVQSACVHMKARFGTWEPTRGPQEKKAVLCILYVIKRCQGFEACCHRH